MPDDDQDQGPSLEPPSLFGRNKTKKKKRPVPPVAASTVDSPAFVSTAQPVRALEKPTVSGPVETPDQKAAASEKAPRRLPRPSGRTAAVVAGLLVGGVLVGLIYVGFQGCEAVVGTSSCGTGPGMAILIAIFVLSVLAGRLLLRLFGVADPGSTSFLGVGLTCVVALLALVDVLDTWPIAIVIPVVTALTFVLSWWVTTTFVEPARD